MRHLGLALTTLLACVAVAPADAGALRRGVEDSVQNLDPHDARTPTARLVARDLFEGLFTIDAGRRPVPGAAQGVEVGDGGLLHVVRLRPDGRWSNGDLVTAQHFVAAFRRLAERLDGGGRVLLRAVANGDAVMAGRAPSAALGVEASDDLTLRIRLEKPRASLAADLADVAFSPLHPTTARAGEPSASVQDVPVGNGPYRVTDRTPDGGVALARNPHFREVVPIEEVRYVPLRRDRAVGPSLFTDGRLDIAPLEGGEIDQARETAPDELRSSDLLSGTYAMVVAGPGAPLAQRADARAALALALDRAALIGSVSPPGLRPLDTLLPGRVGGYAPEPPLERSISPGERRVRAAELLAEGRGLPLSAVRLCVAEAGGPARRQVSHRQVSRRQVLAVGLLWHLALGLRPDATPERPGSSLAPCDVRFVTLAVDVADPLGAFGSLLEEVGADRVPDAARHLDAAAAEADLGRRSERLREAERALLASSRIIPLWGEAAHVLVKPRVSGWRPSDPNLPTRFLATTD